MMIMMMMIFHHCRKIVTKCGKSSESVQCAITDPCLPMRHRPST